MAPQVGRLLELGMIAGTLRDSQGLSVFRAESDARLHANLPLLVLWRAALAELGSSCLAPPGRQCGVVAALGVRTKGQGVSAGEGEAVGLLRGWLRSLLPFQFLTSLKCGLSFFLLAPLGRRYRGQ